MNISFKELNELKNILNNQYDEVKEFFYQIMINNTYSHKILINQRVYLLYKIFETIFTLYPSERLNENFNINGIILNINSINALENSGNKRILVIDDIVTNGKNLNNICEYLINNFKISSEQIGIWIYNCSHKVKYINKDFKINHIHYVTEKEWKINLNKLINFIIQSNIGNVSYTDSYNAINIKKSELCALIEKKYPFAKQYPSEEITLIKNNIDATIFFFNFNQFGDILFCLRIYESKYRTLLIPTVFLPELSIEKCNQYCSNILQSIGISIIDKDFQNIELLYKFTIKELSEWFIKKICYSIQISKEKNLETQESYLNNKKICEKLSLYLNEDLCANYFKKETNNYSDFLKIFNIYLSNINKVDDENNKQIYGISYNKIFKYLKNIDKYKILSQIIYSCDSFKSSYFIFNNNISINNYILSNEQSYKLLYEAYPKEYSYCYWFFRRTYCINPIELQKLAEYLNKNNFDNQFLRYIDFSNILDDLRAIPPEQKYNYILNIIQEYIKNYLF